MGLIETRVDHTRLEFKENVRLFQQLLDELVVVEI